MHIRKGTWVLPTTTTTTKNTQDTKPRMKNNIHQPDQEEKNHTTREKARINRKLLLDAWFCSYVIHFGFWFHHVFGVMFVSCCCVIVVVFSFLLQLMVLVVLHIVFFGFIMCSCCLLLSVADFVHVLFDGGFGSYANNFLFVLSCFIRNCLSLVVVLLLLYFHFCWS